MKKREFPDLRSPEVGISAIRIARDHDHDNLIRVCPCNVGFL